MQTPTCRTAPVAASPSSPSPSQSNAPLGAAEYLRFFKTIIPRSGTATDSGDEPEPEPAWARWLRIHDQSPQVVFEIRLDPPEDAEDAESEAARQQCKERRRELRKALRLAGLHVRCLTSQARKRRYMCVSADTIRSVP